MMSELSTELANLLAKLPRYYEDLGSSYKANVAQNAEALDALLVVSPREHDSVDTTSQAAQIVLGPAAVLKPVGDGYEMAKKRTWDTACWLPAGCIIKLRNPIEVALALALVRKFQVRFAVRSGGHMANPGFSSIGESGILLDLAEMRKIHLSEDCEIATVGPAATWDAVYEELEKYKRTVVGGRLADIGVAGLLLGGGMSHFTNYWGMACDNVRSFEVVLADSSIVKASAAENSDLFSALRGGGPNFGIITECELYTYPDYTLWYGMKAYSPTDSEAVMKATVEVQKAMERDDRMGGFFISAKEGFTVGLLYRGSAPDEGVFAAFDGIAVASELLPATVGTTSALAKILAMPGPYRPKIGTISVRPDANLYIRLYREMQELMADSPASIPMTFNFQPVGRSTQGLGKSKGGNCLNIPPESQTWLVVITQWEHDGEAELAQSKTNQILQKIRSAASEMGLLLDFTFMNDASRFQSPLDGYGEKSISILKAASQKWDPDGVFQKLQNDGFLLCKTRANH